MSAPVNGWTLFWPGPRMSRHENGRRLPGDPVAIGGQVTLIGGRIVPCKWGLHGSERLLDALGYSPCDTPVIGYCEFGGTIKRETDKLAARSRTVLLALDEAQSETVLRTHARWSALTVLHLWEAPDVVVRYLVTGAAAGAAARDASNTELERLAWAAHAGEPVTLAIPDSARDIVARVMGGAA